MPVDHADLLRTLLKQHSGLRQNLNHIDSIIRKDGTDAAPLFAELELFKTTLKTHLELEDGTFYPELLRMMREKGMDTAQTEDFIAKMKEIGEAVSAFLADHGTSEQVLADWKKVRERFDAVDLQIRKRMYAEEEGVYLYLKQ